MVTMNERHIRITERVARARDLVPNVHPISGLQNAYAIEGSEGKFYMIEDRCSCPDAKYRGEVHGGWCKHRIAVALFQDKKMILINL